MGKMLTIVHLLCNLFLHISLALSAIGEGKGFCSNCEKFVDIGTINSDLATRTNRVVDGGT